ncbi:unnamed protein product [Clonostachys byssicola]|uniref:Cytochrome b5 heme-binding domain-containing protein n=1 Tax=Clonostachys byssicola TaxID=160290 RepID=A0A9N9Y7X5_9HYPO|nr:unnamed protein product [Clonostachys byssicola]
MSGKFEPKAPVNLDPPKDDPISLEELAKANGKSIWIEMNPCTEGQKCYVAIKALYDVTGNKAYQPGGSYNVFAGKDASRALGKSSVKPEDVSANWQDLPDSEKKVLDDWVTFFSKRYNIVGRVEGATNTD